MNPCKRETFSRECSTCIVKAPAGGTAQAQKNLRQRPERPRLFLPSMDACSAPCRKGDSRAEQPHTIDERRVSQAGPTPAFHSRKGARGGPGLPACQRLHAGAWLSTEGVPVETEVSRRRVHDCEERGKGPVSVSWWGAAGEFLFESDRRLGLGSNALLWDDLTLAVHIHVHQVGCPP
jgi:hypothetical protein